MNISDICISVALVTRNRPESLERCLKSWRAQTTAPFEIVVSDDSDNFYSTEIEELAQQFNCVYTRGPRRGLYANRNHASLTCQGTHILSADDDHTHPVDYVERILQVVATDATRVWIFSERHPSQPDAPLACPPELHPKGHGCTPKDSSNCAAIADGSSAYPRQIFDQGLRYDETYAFGHIWYLWGQVLVKNGWRISFSDSTFVWHHCLTDGREFDASWLKRQFEANIYVLFVCSWWIKPSMMGSMLAFANLAKLLTFNSSFIGYRVTTKLHIKDALRLVKKAWIFRFKYQYYLHI